MEFNSILNLRKSPYEELQREVFFEDLNINQIIQRICAGWGEEVESYYYYLPADVACEEYRAGVYSDIKAGEVFEALSAYEEQVSNQLEMQVNKEKVSNKMQKAVWHIREVECYCNALISLYEKLEGFCLRSDGMTSLKAYLKTYLESDAFLDLNGTSEALLGEIRSFRLKLQYQGDRILVSEEQTNGNYDNFLKTCFPKKDNKFKNPFSATVELTAFEREVIRVFRKNHEETFKKIEEFYRRTIDYRDEKLSLFQKEIRYYLSFYSFEREMKEKGCSFAAPGKALNGEIEVLGLYDLALACVNLQEDKPVVSNDFCYEKEDTFIVLTGPNQGGKTTFARSLGQLIYFTKMGLDVPAVSAVVSDFTRILTHFSVEESIETGRGKLKEELIRLKPMMQEHFQGAFVIINELFTTAANYDACIMGKKVIQHFIEQGCRGIYVTHLKELTQAHESVVSAKAMVDENKRQTFRVCRGEPLESAYAINQVNKYQLTYEQIMERLAKKQIGKNVEEVF